MSYHSSASIAVPASLEDIIHNFGAKTEPFDVTAVSQALGAARAGLEAAPEVEQRSAWCEVLAFALVGNRSGASPWGTYFAPMGSGTDKDGKTVFFPDASQASPSFIDHWAARARLKASCARSALCRSGMGVCACNRESAA